MKDRNGIDLCPGARVRIARGNPGEGTILFVKSVHAGHAGYPAGHLYGPQVCLTWGEGGTSYGARLTTDVERIGYAIG